MNIKPIVLAAALVATCATQAYAQESTADSSANARPATTTTVVAASAPASATSKQNVGLVIAKAAAKDPATTFSPDYSHALTPGQMTAAWQAELDRLMPQPPSTP